MNPTAIVELTENCNMACDFCLRPSFTPPIIKLNTLENIIRHVIENSDLKADFIWHGGEPLLAGLDIFQQIPLIQQKYNSRKILVNNNVQTNGTKLSPEFIDFFQSQSFAIGTSIQGTKETHDISRVTIGKKPTYDLIVSNIGKLSNKPASILVLTTKLLGKEEEI
ncbi:MAG: radical SAM protein, partial [archaeon]